MQVVKDSSSEAREIASLLKVLGESLGVERVVFSLRTFRSSNIPELSIAPRKRNARSSSSFLEWSQSHGVGASELQLRKILPVLVEKTLNEPKSILVESVASCEWLESCRDSLRILGVKKLAIIPVFPIGSIFILRGKGSKKNLSDQLSIAQGIVFNFLEKELNNKKTLVAPSLVEQSNLIGTQPEEAPEDEQDNYFVELLDSLKSQVDTSNLALQTLISLCGSSSKRGGFCFVKTGSNSYELLASLRLTESLKSLFEGSGGAGESKDVWEEEDLDRILSFFQDATDKNEIVDISDTAILPKNLMLGEVAGSLVLAPLVVGEQTFGFFGLLGEGTAEFTGSETCLVEASARLLGLTRSREILQDSVQILNQRSIYFARFSKKLRECSSNSDIFNSTFSFLSERYRFKRQWFGMLNDSGSHLTGAAGRGEGLPSGLLDLSIPLEAENGPFSKVLNSKSAMILKGLRAIEEKFPNRNIFSLLNIEGLLLVPVMSGVNRVGVLLLEFNPRINNLAADDISFILRLTSEVAENVLVLRQKDDRFFDAKMKTAGFFASGIAHNFNNLLQAIMGQASLLQLQGDRPEELSTERIKSTADHILKASEKGAQLVKQLMNFTNFEAPRSEVCPVHRLLDSSIASIPELAQGQRQILFNYGENIPSVTVDPQQLKRVFIEILRNAVSATDPEQGELKIGAQRVRIEAGTRYPLLKRGYYVKIEISDNGPGMSSQTADRCFEPFFTTKDLDATTGLGRSGAGLGLAAAYSIVKRNGGAIVAEGGLGRGATFGVYLPVAFGFIKSAATNQVSNGEENLALTGVGIEGCASSKKPDNIH